MVVNKKLDIIIFSENCVGCRLCQMRCSFRFTKRFSFSDARIDIEWDEGKYRYGINFSEGCDQCGLCASVCVYEALTLKRKGVKEVHAR
jgi:Fe-S-cluster-containing dehydrogenase component